MLSLIKPRFAWVMLIHPRVLWYRNGTQPKLPSVQKTKSFGDPCCLSNGNRLQTWGLGSKPAPQKALENHRWPTVPWMSNPNMNKEVCDALNSQTMVRQGFGVGPPTSISGEINTGLWKKTLVSHKARCHRFTHSVIY